MINPWSFGLGLIAVLSGVVLVVSAVRFIFRRRSAEPETEHVQCPECGRDNMAGNDFCIRCDAPLPPDDSGDL